MDFIKPKKILDQKNDWLLSKQVKMIIEFYSEYTGYSESEVVEMFLKNIFYSITFVYSNKFSFKN